METSGETLIEQALAAYAAGPRPESPPQPLHQWDDDGGRQAREDRPRPRFDVYNATADTDRSAVEVCGGICLDPNFSC